MDFLEIFRVDVLWNDANSFFLKIFRFSLPFAKFGRFSFFLKRFCPQMFSKTVKDRDLKFSEIIHLKY